MHNTICGVRLARHAAPKTVCIATVIGRAAATLAGFTFASLVFPVLPTIAQSVPRGGSAVRGSVIDASGAPLSGAVIVRDGLRPETASVDVAGRFAIQGLARGRHIFHVYSVGYNPVSFEVTFEADTAVNIEVPLEGRVAMLDTLEIVADRALGRYVRKLTDVGFAERRRLGEQTASGATFLTPEYIEARRPGRLSHLLDNVRSLHVQYQANKAVPYGRDNRCVMSVWLDGQEIRGLFPPNVGGSAFQSGGRVSSNFPGLDGLPVGDVAAIEVYPSAVVTPPQFQNLTGGCGAIVIWTKQ